MKEAVLYYRTTKNEAHEILDNGFQGDTVSLYSLSTEGEDANQGDVLLQVKTGLSSEDMDYYAVFRGNGLPLSWSIPAAALNPYCEISYMAELTVGE